MRKRYRILILATIVAALAVPFGFALESDSVVAVSRPVVAAAPVVSAASTRADPGETRGASLFHPFPDGVKLFVVGTMLFGLAAAVRRTV